MPTRCSNPKAMRLTDPARHMLRGSGAQRVHKGCAEGTTPARAGFVALRRKT